MKHQLYSALCLLVVCLWVSQAAAATPSVGSWLGGMDLEEAPRDEDTADPSAILTMSEAQPLQIPCGVIRTTDDDVTHVAGSRVHPLATILDTSLPTTTMTLAAAKTKGLLDLMVGPDDNNSHYIPAGKLWLRMVDVTVPAPAILVVDMNSGLEEKQDASSAFALRLGLDFLRQYESLIDLREGELRMLVEGNEYMVPFMRPRPSVSFGEDL